LSLGQRITLGLPALDETLGGIRAGEVCGLMGRPGIGKTVLLCHIAQAVSESVGHVIFSLEMPGAQIVGRLKQRLYNVGRYELEEKSRADALNPEPYRRAFQNLVIVDTPGLSVAEMGRRLRQIAQGPLRGIPIGLVTIDHLGLVGGDRSLSTYDRVSAQSRDIKELAKRAGCAVLLAVQVSREAGGDGSRELGLGSARDSGVIEEAMDYLVGIRRLDRSLTLSPFERDKYKDIIFAKVIKNRHGDPGHSEIAYRLFPVGLRLKEDTSIRADENDVARIAAQRAGGNRR
jgi:replicative DNA helicase